MLQYLQLRKHKVHKFQPKVKIYQEAGPFILKTVSNSDELIEALKLRYEVFHLEMIGRQTKTKVDVDAFDFICDHLIIVDKKSQKIVGTYRLNCSLFSAQFYSANEFNLRRILEQPGSKLELGRACIHSDYRRGIVISMLWRGIAEYMNATGSQILFGCASIKTESARCAALIYQYFKQQGRFKEEYLTPPMSAYSMENLDLWIASFKERSLTEVELNEAEELIPPLCRAYLKAGAYLGGEPAYDPEFRCIDFLTILPLENLNRTLWRKYKLGAEDCAQPTTNQSSQVIHLDS